MEVVRQSGGARAARRESLSTRKCPHARRWSAWSLRNTSQIENSFHPHSL